MSTRWDELKRWTQARIGLGRAGTAVPTKALLEFQWAHARARDAVHRPWDAAALAKAMQATGEKTCLLESQATTRAEYLQRPDRGRQLSTESLSALAANSFPTQLVICVSDGLSAAAIEKHWLPFWKVFSAELKAARYSYAPIMLVPFGRVAISDAIGEALGAQLALIFVGERPGLTAADSLGAYLTYAPKRGTADARRNCLSNIRPPEGLSYELATKKLLYLIAESSRRQLSGVELKEETGLPRAGG